MTHYLIIVAVGSFLFGWLALGKIFADVYARLRFLGIPEEPTTVGDWLVVLSFLLGPVFAVVAFAILLWPLV